MSGAGGVVDPHHHFWTLTDGEHPWRGPEHEAMARDFGPDDLAPCLQEAGVGRTVLVQSVDEPAENERMLRIAAQVAHVAGIVAWLPLARPQEAAPMVEGLAAQDPVRGVRCLIGRGDAAWLTRPPALAVFGDLAAAGLCWDVVPVTGAQVEQVLTVADAVPDLRIVVDHLCRPPVETGGWEPWAGTVARLARRPGVAMKVSIGIDLLTPWRRWDAAALPRYLSWALECFGSDRLMLASNWPVVLLRASYTRAWQDLGVALVAAGADPAAVRGGTAAHWYRLADPGR